jgi:choice-of-anchor A domain-containing protein
VVAGRNAVRTAGFAAVLLGMVGLCAGVALTATAAQAPGVPVNPVRPVSAADPAADPSHHFLVLVEGAAQLYGNESEGPVVVGGDVTWGGYQVAPRARPNPYVVPGDSVPAGLVVRGGLDFAGSQADTLAVLNQTNGYFAGLAGADVVPNGGITHVTPPGGNSGTLPAIAVHRAQTEQSMARDPGFDLPALFGTYRTLSGEIASCAGTVTLLDGNGNGPWPGSGVATIRLVPGQNVLNLTVAQLRTLGNLNLANGSAQPGAATLVINVTDGGDYELPVPTLGFQGSAVSAYILWNLATSGTVTLPAGEGDTVWGTVYAPGARLVDLSPANIEGNAVARELAHGSTSADGGEIHDAPFLGTVTPCGDAPTTTTTTPTTTTTTTTEPTTTTTTTGATTSTTTTTTDATTTTTTTDTTDTTTTTTNATTSDTTTTTTNATTTDTTTDATTTTTTTTDATTTDAESTTDLSTTDSATTTTPESGGAVVGTTTLTDHTGGGGSDGGGGAGPGLAGTGSPAAGLVLGGALLVVAGGCLLLVARARR